MVIILIAWSLNYLGTSLWTFIVWITMALHLMLAFWHYLAHYKAVNYLTFFCRVNNEVVIRKGTITDCGTPVINESDPGRPLKLLHHPIALSFSLFDEHVLTDPCDEEEGIQAGSLTVVCNENGKLCDVYKPGGAPLDAAVLEKCVTRTAKRVTESLELLKNSCS